MSLEGLRSRKVAMPLLGAGASTNAYASEDGVRRVTARASN